MYDSKSQRYYDVIHSWKNYAREAADVKRLVSAHKRSTSNTLLDVACGTGAHVPYLRDVFAYEGIDLDPEMLAVARERFPDVPFHQGNMVDFALGRQFDVVTCLYSAIAYAYPEPQLQRAINNMAGHLRPGGILLVGAFLAPEEWALGQIRAMFVDQPDLKLARFNVSDVEGTVAIVDFHYLLATSAGVEYFTEHRELGLYTPEQYRTAFIKAGLSVMHDHEWPEDPGIYIGMHPFSQSGA